MNSLLAEDACIAVMDDADEPKPENPIHSTAGARDYGFRGALVGGVTVFGWGVRTILRALGERWLDDGWAHLRFRKPVYPGDALRTSVGVDGTFSISRASDGCIEGEVGLGTAPWLHSLNLPQEQAPTPRAAVVPRLTPDNVPVGRALATRAVELSRAAAIEFARLKENETDPRFVGTAPRAHPAWIAAQPIHLLHHSFDYGPAIHAESHIQFLTAAPVAARYLVAGQCVDAFERNGHHYLVNDCSLRVSGCDIARIRHTVIYQVARRTRD